MKTRNGLFAFEPQQVLTLGLCGVIVVAVVVSHLVRGALGSQFATMGLLTVAYAAAALGVNRFTSGTAKLMWQSALTIVVLFALYFILATLPFAVMPYSADPVLARVDTALGLGTPIALWAERFATPSVVNVSSFFYSVFIPYVYVSIFMNLYGRPEAERHVFILAFALTYTIGFLGYLFMPAKGPVAYHAADFAAPLTGGYFYRLVVNTIEQAGGPHGAFPSLHVGASWCLCLFDLKYNRIRGLLYVPIVLMIVVATVVLRYHYVIDLAAGLAIGTFALKTAETWASMEPES